MCILYVNKILVNQKKNLINLWFINKKYTFFALLKLIINKTLII